MPPQRPPSLPRKRIWLLPTLAFILSIPSFAADVPASFFQGCTGGFFDTAASCTSSALLPFYSLYAFLVMLSILEIVLIPLSLVLVFLSLTNIFKTNRDSLWWVYLTLDILTVLGQLYFAWFLISLWF
jgi:ABC-type dipeptide/oligopeptide/nickel transport system permease subunit